MKKKKLTAEDIDLSVMAHSLPLPVLAAAHSAATDAARSILDYALIQDAARLLNLAQATIRHWVASGKLEATQWHAQRIVRVSEVRHLRDNPPTRGRPIKRPITPASPSPLPAAPSAE